MEGENQTKCESDFHYFTELQTNISCLQLIVWPSFSIPMKPEDYLSKYF